MKTKFTFKQSIPSSFVSRGIEPIEINFDNIEELENHPFIRDWLNGYSSSSLNKSRNYLMLVYNDCDGEHRALVLGQITNSEQLDIPIYIKPNMSLKMIEQFNLHGDMITINGVKYKRLEEPKPPTIRNNVIHILETHIENPDDIEIDIDALSQEIVDSIKEFLPYPLYSEDLPQAYRNGWNHCLSKTATELNK